MEGFNPDVVTIDRLARQLAMADNDCVRTDHIIQAMLNFEQSIGGVILKQLHISPKEFLDTSGRMTSKIAFVESGDNNVSQEVVAIVSSGVKSAYIKAKVIAYQCHRDCADTQHLLLAILQDKECSGAIKLAKFSVDSELIEPIVASIEDMQFSNLQQSLQQEVNILDEKINIIQQNSTQKEQEVMAECKDWGYDLTAYSLSSREETCGRQNEIARLLHILNRRYKNNVLLIGEAGVGKTAIVEGCAKALFERSGKHIFCLDIAGFMGGAKYRGDCEKRWQKLLKELKSSGSVLFIDEIHTIMSAGDKEGGMTLANLLKPMLARDGISVIGATTFDEHKQYLERDAALMRRFQTILVEAPNVVDCTAMIIDSVKSLADFHNIEIPEGVIKRTVELSDRYIKDRQLPDKALDILDEAGAKISAEPLKEHNLKRVMKEQDIIAIIAASTGIPNGVIAGEQSTITADIAARISKIIIGQEEAVAVVSRAVSKAYSKFKDNSKPIHSMLFVGESGVGKTALASALAELVFGEKKSLIRLDMSEFMEKHSISRIIGASKGYIGYDDGNTVADIIRKQPHSVLLLDEIEKADSDVLNILLQVLDAGRLTDTHGRAVDCTNLIVIMTSNLGVTTQKAVGFISNPKVEPQQEIKKFLRAELVNRIDDIVVFNKLTETAFCEIAKRELRVVSDKMKEQGFTIEYTKEVLQHIVGQGEIIEVRALKRAIKTQVEDKITQAMYQNPCKKIVEITIINNQIVCR